MATILQIHDFNAQELRQLIKEVVSEELCEFKNLHNKDSSPPPNSESNQLLTSKEAAQFLKVSTVTLTKYIKTGDIKTYRAGKRRRFKQSDLEAYLQILHQKLIKTN